jgi:hypothetical protein
MPCLIVNLLFLQKYWQSGQEEGTYLTVEWTNQHGCGGNEDNDPHKLNCNMVIQYMVMDYDPDETAEELDTNKFTRIRDGTSTQRQDFTQPSENTAEDNYQNSREGNVKVDRGLHESYDYYADCTIRQRNQYLFAADQNLRGSTARFTRQNPNGNRNGYECPEERDYYPYWHPTPWRDIAVLTDNTTLCNFYKNESFNVKPRGICRGQKFGDEAGGRPYSPHNNQEDCEGDEDEENPGVWFTEYAYIDISSAANQRACEAEMASSGDGLRRVWSPPSYDVPAQCLVLPGPPECQQVGWTRVNHLGNGREGTPLNYTWRLPYFPSGKNKIAVLRIRYNISTDDYDPWRTNSSYNENLFFGIRSPITQNPYVNIGATTNKPLRLAINTAQFGRTFQDRSHVFELRPRSLLTNSEARSCEILNLNVRGKRGNIVQTYPAVEYDFFPNRFTVTEAQCLHVQWTGSNTHNNNSPAGDGQAGDAGEGTGGTDRSNMVQTPGPNVNYPTPYDKTDSDDGLFKNADVLWSSAEAAQGSDEDIAVFFASAGYYQCVRQTTCGDESVQAKNPMDQLLNNAPASFEGALLRLKRGTYYYICSRNNNFTNRSQKGVIIVTP